jgi:hypothetical protein
MEFFQVFLDAADLLVEKPCGAGLSWEVNTEYSIFDLLDLDLALAPLDNDWRCLPRRLLLLFVVVFVSHFFALELDLEVLIRNCVFNLVVLEVLDELFEHPGDLIGGEELCALVWLGLVLAGEQFNRPLLRIFCLLGFRLRGKVKIRPAMHFGVTSVHALLCNLGHLLLVHLSLSFSWLLHSLLADCKLMFDFISCGVRLPHPWVIDNVSQRKSLIWIVLEHSRDEILEVVRKEIGLCLAKEKTVLVPE